MRGGPIFLESIRRRGPWPKLYLPMPNAARHIEVSEELWDIMHGADELPPHRIVNGTPHWKATDLDALRPAIGTVYFVEMGDFIKIGFTRSLENRLTQFASSLPLPVALLHSLRGTIGLERFYHAKFDQLRARGEWFRKGADLVAFVAELAK